MPFGRRAIGGSTPPTTHFTRRLSGDESREGVEEHELESEEPAAKRVKLGHPEVESSSLAQFKAGPETEAVKADRREKVKGIALVKPE
jgi:hypothetical protein